MEPLMSNIFLVLYITAWIVTIIVYQKKRQHLDAGSVLLFSYLLYSIASLFLYNNPFSIYTFNQIRIFPFIYLYLMLMLAASPVLRYDVNKINKIQKPNTVLLNTVCIIFIVASLAHLPTIISDFSNSLIKLLINSSGGDDLYQEGMLFTHKTGYGNITNLAAVISNAMSSIGILLFFYYLTQKKYNKLILIGLFLSCIVSILTSISRGQRGGIVETLLVMIITYFALRKFIPTKVNKIIKIIGIFLIITIAVPLIALTNSRFGYKEGSSKASLFFYAGQENLYFNNYGLDDGGIRYGDRTFPLFKRMLGINNVPNNFWERRQKYPNLKINDEVFITFVGDFTLDFGPFVAPLIFILFTLFILHETRIRNGRILFHQLILVHFVMNACMVGGLKLYSFSDVGGNLSLIVYFVAFICFRLDYDNSLQRKKRNKV
jgi:oligosaccharide repeat unit polymerase